MQEHCNNYLLNQVEELARLQAEGKYLAASEWLAESLPLPNIEQIPDIEYVHTPRSGWGYRAPWGTFLPTTISGAWMLVDGDAPEEQTPLKAATLTVQDSRVYIQIADELHPTELRWMAGEHPYQLLERANKALRNDPALGVVACKLVWEDAEFQKRVHQIRLANDHVSVVCASAVWDAELQQLVAVTLVSPELQSLKAITATLYTNAKKILALSVDGKSHAIQNTRRKYISISGSLAAVGAEGHLLALLHPLSGNPQEQSENHFYLVISPEESTHTRFVERLNLAIPYPVREHWAEYLFESGLQANLVRRLSLAGDDFPNALWVSKSGDWRTIIENGLKDGEIRL
jgi:hypothetical protein